LDGVWKVKALLVLRNEAPNVLESVVVFSFLQWHTTVCSYPKVAISKHFTVNQAETFIEVLSLI
jgi:hypothetical protein